MSDAAIVNRVTGQAWRYAQEYAGQKLHIVEMRADGSVENYAVCGRNNHKRGVWRMTINMPLRHACRNCCKIMWPPAPKGTA